MTHIYLRYENAAGSGEGVELYPGKSYFLPNEAPNTQAIDVVEEMDATHSVTKLGIYERDVLVSTYGSTRTEVLEGGGIGRYKIPISTMAEQGQIFIVLRKGDQILTPSGRWSLVWRTGESQWSEPVSAMHSNRVRSFDASAEVEDSQSQDDESSIPHDAADNFIFSMEDTGYGTPALASVLMPPPPLPRVDIVLDPAKDDEDDGKMSEADVDEEKQEERMQEKTSSTSDIRPLSQSTRAALSELSTNSVIMLRTNVSESSLVSPSFNGGLLRDENGDLRYPEDAISALKRQIDDIHDRRISQSCKDGEPEDDLPDHRRFEEHENTTESVDSYEEESTVRRVDFEAYVAVDGHVSTGASEDLHTERMVVVVEGRPLETHADSPAAIDTGTDYQARTSTSGTDRRSLAEAGCAIEQEQVHVPLKVSMESSDPLPAEEQMTTPAAEIPLASSGSSAKRKATTYSRKETLRNKRSKAAPKESHSNQEDDEEESTTVAVVPTRKKTVPSNGEEHSPIPRCTSRTPKPTTNSTPPESSTKSTKARGGRKPRNLMNDSTPSRSRSSSTASSTHVEQYLGLPPKILFASSTTVDRKKDTMKDFTKLGCEKVDDINQANILIVGGTKLKKTAKLIIAVARGMDVVNERWIVESRRKDILLDIIPFVPEDDAHEAEWGFTLADATARGKEGVVQALLKDTTVHTTKDFDKFPAARELPSIVKALGGNIVKSSLPSGKSRTKNVLILGTREDSQAVEVQRIGHKLFDKDLIILGALRGKIDTESPEFEIGVPVKEEESD